MAEPDSRNNYYLKNYSFKMFEKQNIRIFHPCADPEGGTGGPNLPPPWNLKISPKKKVISGFWGVGPPPSSVTKNYHFRWTPSHENFWIRACHPRTENIEFKITYIFLIL